MEQRVRNLDKEWRLLHDGRIGGHDSDGGDGQEDDDNDGDDDGDDNDDESNK